jgi:outer membrane protein assembly factor BamB
MKRPPVFWLALLLAAATARGAEHATLLARVRQQTRAALRSVGDEVKSWMGAMHNHVAGVRRGVESGAASVRDAGRQSADEVKNVAGYLGRETTRNLHDGLTVVAREFVPVGERATIRPTTVTTAAVSSPVAEPVFLRRYDLQLAWRITTGGRPIRRSLLLDDNLLLEDVSNTIYALNAHNGITSWVFPLPAPSQYDYDTDDQVIAIIANDVLYELDRDVGLPRRRTVLPFATASQPTLRGKSIILSSADDRLYSLNREDRTREWSHLASDHVLAGIATQAGTVYYAQTDGKVYGYVPGSRKPLWEYKADDTILVALVVEGDNLLFPAHDLFVHSINRLGGFRTWKFPTRGRVTQPVWAEKETVYFSADGDGFYAVSREKGEQLWYLGGAKWPVAIGQKNIYLEGPDQSILCVDRATGKELWRVSAKPFVHFVRNTDTDHIYLVTDVGQVYAFYVRGDHVEKKVKEGPKPPVPPKPPGVEEPLRIPPKAGPKVTPPKPAPKKAAPKEEVEEEEKPKPKPKAKAKVQPEEEEEKPVPKKKAAKEEELDEETKKAREALEKAAKEEPEEEEEKPAKEKAPAKKAAKGAKEEDEGF